MIGKPKIRVRNGFSDRNGIQEIPKIIQYEDFTDETRIVFFNTILKILKNQIRCSLIGKQQFCEFVVEELFNRVYDEYRDTFNNVIGELNILFVSGTYDEVLTTIEFLCSSAFISEDEYRNEQTTDFFMDNYINPFDLMNECFEDEFAGYRFINEFIVKITNKNEISSIIESTKTPYDEVNNSISKSIALLSETGTKDYENAIKEAILATEQCLNIILNTEGQTLSACIQMLFDKAIINDNLKKTIKDLYNYASDTNGIRHGNNKQNNIVTFGEAKYILLLCSATINYLITLKIN